MGIDSFPCIVVDSLGAAASATVTLTVSKSKDSRGKRPNEIIGLNVLGNNAVKIMRGSSFGAAAAALCLFCDSGPVSCKKRHIAVQAPSVS